MPDFDFTLPSPSGGGGFDFSLPNGEDPMLSSARGRAVAEQQNIQDNLDKLIKLRENVKDPNQAARLDRLIEHYTSVKTGSVGDFIKSAAVGASTIPMNVADLALGLGPSEVSDKAARLRRAVQEGISTTREMAGAEPGTIASTVGELGGGMVAGAPIYGRMAQATGSAVAKAIPALEPIVTGAVEGGPVTRTLASGGANVIAGAPVNIAQAVSSEGTFEDKIKQAAIQTGADFLFGMGHVPTKEQASARAEAIRTDNGNIPATPNAGGQELSAQLASKQAEADAIRGAQQRVRKQAQARWTIDNPDGDWKSLGKVEKQAIYDQYAKPVEKPNEPVTTQPATPVPGMTSEESANLFGDLSVQDLKAPVSPNEPKLLTVEDIDNQLDNVYEQMDKVGPESKNPDPTSYAGLQKNLDQLVQQKLVLDKGGSVSDQTQIPTSTSPSIEPVAQTGSSIDLNDPMLKATPKNLSVDELVAHMDHAISQIHNANEVGDTLAAGTYQKFLDKLSVENTRRSGMPVTEMEQGDVASEPVGTQLDPKLLKASPSRIPNEQLDLQVDHIRGKMEEAQSLSDPEGEQVYKDRLTKLMDEKTNRQQAKPLTANVPPGVAGGLLGFTYGLMNGDEKDEDYYRKAFMYAMLGAGAGYGLKKGGDYMSRVNAMKKSNELFPGEMNLRKGQLADDGKPAPTVSNIFDKVGRWTGKAYEQTAYKAFGARKLAESFPGASPFAKQVETAGRWRGKAMDALARGVMLEDGTRVSKGLPEILKMVNGDSQGLDRVALALASAEGAIAGRKVPMDQATREAYISNAPNNYIEAAKQLRQYHYGLMQVLHEAGGISDKAIEAMGKEEWYTHLRDTATKGEVALGMQPTTGQQRVVFSREGGSNASKISPIELAIEDTGRIMRSAETGKALGSLVDFAQGQPAEIRDAILKSTYDPQDMTRLKMATASTEMAKKYGLTTDQATQLLSYLGQLDPSAKGGKIQLWRNGKLEKFLVNSDVLSAVKTMSPPEFDWVKGVVGKLAQTASRGSVYWPSFLAPVHFVLRNWAGYIQSKYGQIPLVDSINGLMASALRTPKYREMLSQGGASALEAYRFVEPKARMDAIESLNDPTVVHAAVRQAKELNLFEAWKTLVQPVLEAHEVAEYLAARRHGASAQEAAYASANITGNNQMQGASKLMNAFNTMSVFSRPAISALDAAATNTGLNPLRSPEAPKVGIGAGIQKMTGNVRLASATSTIVRAIGSVMIPSMIMWDLNKDDKEITRLRQSPVGSRYWFMRNPQDGQIIKMRKPKLYGEVFGTMIEQALDKAHGTDPQSTSDIVKSFIGDASFNLIPYPLQIGGSLWANKAMGSDTPIVPERDVGAEPSVGGEDTASPIARGLARAVAPWSSNFQNSTLRTATSPAGIDYMLGAAGGMAGQQGLQLMGVLQRWSQTGDLPPKEELPILNSVFAKYPSLSSGPITKFYDVAQKVDQTVKTLDYYMEHDPSKIADYYKVNSQWLQLADVYGPTRKSIADYRRAIEDIRNMPGLTPDKRRTYINNYTEQMIREAEMANSIMKNMDQSSGK